LRTVSPAAIIALGRDVTDLAVGDAVFGVAEQGVEGAYAEKTAIKSALVAWRPDRLLAGTTAIES